MPLSSVVGASSIIQPGVCTSTTRPASPYDGQVIYETDTNLVKAFDGTAFVTVGPPTPGGVLQVVVGTHSTQSTSSTSTFVNTGLQVTITPQFNTSQILVIVNQSGCYKETGNTWQELILLRGASLISTFGGFGGYTNSTASIGFGSVSTTHLDSPATTLVTTYKTQQKSHQNIAIVGCQATNVTSTITAMEISV